jgi:septum formation protein
VLCSDTTVALGDHILGKPEGAADAAQMLGLLSGQTHRVATAVAVHHGEQRLTALSVSHVTFAAMTPAEIDDYVFSGEPMGKAGAYAVQGRAAMYITRIDGSYTAIMGLPLYETATLIRALGMQL